jgi:hypothetical protein
MVSRLADLGPVSTAKKNAALCENDDDKEREEEYDDELVSHNTAEQPPSSSLGPKGLSTSLQSISRVVSTLKHYVFLLALSMDSLSLAQSRNNTYGHVAIHPVSNENSSTITLLNKIIQVQSTN